MMIQTNYQKRKNHELFKCFENPSGLHLSQAQNYNPIYKRFFNLNETNYNNINLDNKLYITSVIYNANDADEKSYNCRVKNIINNKSKDCDVFFKMAPLLDPYKYLIGKYDIENRNLFNLPNISSTDETVHPKIANQNNSAYVDGFFVFLTSKLLHDQHFIHGLDFYGSFLAIKNNFKLNVFDDIEHLNNSEFFNKHKSILFDIDDYEHLFKNNNRQIPINIDHNSTLKSQISINSISDDLFDNVFVKSRSNSELIEVTQIENEINDEVVTIKSSSTCSSRMSNTSDEDNNSDYDDDDLAAIIDDNEEVDEEDEAENEEDEDEEDEDETIELTLKRFPVKVICMEHCEDTFDDLILSNNLTNDEWYSALMQVIMILITYQKTFSFTHNDLHTNNVMYNHTKQKYIFYRYKKITYKVPTFGRLFKIIDFGRSIYKCDDLLFCSDSFQNGEDAATQYNTEPFFNEKKPRLDPNFSFDLCRLACSIFDYIIDDLDEIVDIQKCDPIKRLITEWCLDDKGINLLYKQNGDDRYPDFKLYKMIARHAHKHTPQAQLDRPEFKAFSVFKGDVPKELIDIDSMPILYKI
jgi:hypothetical protein